MTNRTDERFSQTCPLAAYLLLQGTMAPNGNLQRVTYLNIALGYIHIERVNPKACHFGGVR